MCLITTQQEPLITEEDIISYKTLTNKLRSIYYNSYQYNIDELNEIEIKESDEWKPYDNRDERWICEHINYGNASSSLRKKGYTSTAAFKILCANDKTLKCFGQGFHTDLIKDKTHRFGSAYVQCTIPKGSLYYKNDIGLVISNQLIVNRVLDINE